MIRSFAMDEEIQTSATFTNRTTGAPQNPQTVVLRTRDPKGNIATITAVTNPRVGYYQGLFTPTVAGMWQLRWDGQTPGSGPNAVIENQFEVRPSYFPDL